MNIKIVICFIIICLIPAASADTGEVWAAKFSGFIKSNQSVSFENYIVKTKTLDDTKSAISVYRNQAQIETREFNVNDFKKYDNIRISLLGIKGDYSWISISKLEIKDVWRPLAPTQLKWGDTYSIENYTLSIDRFGSNSVNLVISNDSTSQTFMFSTNESIDYENIRIAVKDINSTGFIGLALFTKMAPAINAEISTDRDEYFPDEIVPVTINITSADIQNVVGIYMESDPPMEITPELFSAAGITGTNSFKSRISRLPDNSAITIRANIETRDYFNNKSIVTVSRIINTTPIISIKKQAPGETDEENVNVTLQLRNSGTDTENVSVYETLPQGYDLKPFNWIIEPGNTNWIDAPSCDKSACSFRIGIESGNSTNITYQVSPQEPGQYILPPATAKWKIYSTASRRAVMNMHMPYIRMTKNAFSNRSRTDVELVIKNTGDRPAKVNVSDNIPQGLSVVQGEAMWSKKLEGGESAKMQYSLQGNIETLPAADAAYSDMRGIVRHARSNAIEAGAKVYAKDVNAINDEKAPALKAEKSDIMSFMIFSFIGIAGIITGITLLIYLLATLKRRK